MDKLGRHFGFPLELNRQAKTEHIHYNRNQLLILEIGEQIMSC